MTGTVLFVVLAIVVVPLEILLLAGTTNKESLRKNGLGS